MAAITAANLIILKDRTSLAEDEPALLARAKAGDRQALSALYHEHAGRIYSLSLRVTEDINAAENLTRDIFVETFPAWMRLPMTPRLPPGFIIAR